MNYPITSIFGPTLQGEGHFVGYPAVFVRFAGCSVKNCHIRSNCDEAPWAAKEELDASGILSRVQQLARDGIVVLTGGEPADQDLIPVVSTLNDAGYRVHVETSGTYPIMGLPVEWITVSPKTPDYRQRIGHALKLVVLPGWRWSHIRDYDLRTDFLHRYLQPLTVGEKPINLKEVIQLLTSCENYGSRWALSTQAHRVWGVR